MLCALSCAGELGVHRGLIKDAQGLNLAGMCDLREILECRGAEGRLEHVSAEAACTKVGNNERTKVLTFLCLSHKLVHRVGVCVGDNKQESDVDDKELPEE